MPLDEKTLQRLRDNDPTLTTLTLSDNNFSDAGTQALANALTTNTTLTSLSLLNNKIGDAGAQALADALTTNTTLITLGLDGNDLSATHDQRIKEYLARNQALVQQFLQAATQGDLAQVQALHKRGVAISTAGAKGNTALHLAAAQGHFSLVQWLVAQGVVINQHNEAGKTAFALATQYPTIQQYLTAVLSKRPFKIPREQLTLVGKSLGQGGFGLVKQGIWQAKDVAVKILFLRYDQVPEDLKTEFENEINLINRLHHPNIVVLYGTSEVENMGETLPCMVLELMTNGSLRSYITSSNKKEQPLTNKEQLQITLDITRGLVFLHQQKIIHRDLKTDNVLLDEVLHAKLADFGLAKMKETSSISMTAKVGTPGGWMGPELFDYNAERTVNHTFKSDMFSYAMVLWALWARCEKPFKKADSMVANQWVMQGIRETIPPDCIPFISQLITTCWDINPSKRYTADEALARLVSELSPKPATNPPSTLLPIISAQAEQATVNQAKYVANPCMTLFAPSTSPAKPTAFWSLIHTIAHQQLTLGKKLGQGGFGYVLEGRWQHNKVAIKILFLRSEQLLDELFMEFEKEISLINRLRHPNIVSLYGMSEIVTMGETLPCIVMELLSNGPLRNYIIKSNKNNHQYPLTNVQQHQITLDITCGLTFLHEKKIIHRNLKLNSVLLDENLHAKLGSFSLAKVKEHSQATMTEGVGTPGGWMAPELFEFNAKGIVNHTTKSDMFSYAMVLWALWARCEKPFKGAGSPIVANNWVIQGKRETISPDCTPLIHQLISCCWDADPNKRLTAEEALTQLMAEPSSFAAPSFKPS